MRYLLFILLGLSTFTFANNKTIFNEACQEYDRQNYDQAIFKFTELLNSGTENGEIYYNLGNSYYKKNDVVNALLNYEKAIKLSANDDDLMTNITISRQKIVDKMEEKPQLPFFTFFNNLKNHYNIYTIKPAILYGLLLLSVFFSLLFWFKGSKSRIVIYCLASISGVYLLSVSYIGFNLSQNQNYSFGIISIDKTAVKSSPDENSNNTDLFNLHKGAKVQIHREIDGWLEVSVAKDKKGWINTSSLSKI